VEIDEKKGQIICENLPVIRGHQRQLQQLFFNLIGNALKYSREVEPPVIHIRSRIIRGYESNMKLIYDDRRKSFHLVELTDNGIGFEQKDAERIFQVFQRLHGNTEYRGTGVGLSIVKKVVEHHKGYIEAFGEPGKGATFRILLPVMTEV
jgi:signal transduction histidine kinase